jgi:maltose/moltooligosaccharide transporter
MWIYTTAAVTSHIYGTSDTTSALYNEGANWVGVAFATYNGIAAAVAFAIPVLAKRTSRRIAHAICLVCGAVGLLSIFVISEPRLLLGSMVGVGIAWASILSMPYAILTGSLPPSKMGYYMGVFNFFIVIPQIVAAAILGFFVGRFFGGEAIYALLIGGVSLVLAAALTLRVEDRDDVAAAI